MLLCRGLDAKSSKVLDDFRFLHLAVTTPNLWIAQRAHLAFEPNYCFTGKYLMAGQVNPPNCNVGFIVLCHHGMDILKTAEELLRFNPSAKQMHYAFLDMCLPEDSMDVVLVMQDFISHLQEQIKENIIQ